MSHKNTKIVCTLGPSSNSITEIFKLVQAGMNVARLNFSHGTYKNHQEIIDNILKVEKTTGKRIGILQDLQGPKIRLGELPENGILLKKNDTLILTSDQKTASLSIFSKKIPIQFPDFTKSLKKDDSILFNDGLVEVKVIKILNKKNVKCLVKCGGIIRNHAGVHLPSISNNVKTITEKDKKDLRFGLKNNVDFVALSFVKSAQDIKNLRKLIEKLMRALPKKSTKIIAKIELKAALENLEDIVKVADGLMVARGDLGIDIAAEQVPIAQKRMIKLANKYAKPVITATEVLLSMVSSPRATRAEISDAANAIFDHTDAIMLSNESAIGKYPAKATATLSKVAHTVEQELQKYPELLRTFQPDKNSNPHCQSACELSIDTRADFLVVYTSDGFSAREIAKHRTYTPIITITESEQTARELTLVWGLNLIFTHKIPENNSTKVEEIIKFLKAKKAVKKGQKLVIICNASKKEKLISNITV